MSTFHKIVLAIAGSWNNGTSSPAPQGNRAWSNKPTALAERQEPTSAKTPPLLNRIGKGIGKFWIPILLVIATALTTSQIERVEAAWDSEKGQTAPPPPPTPDPVDILLTWGSTNSATSTPAAVPPPLLAPAAPVIKETALAAGTWLVAVIAEWAIHEAMDQAAKNAEGQEATCGIEWVKWEENSTTLTWEIKHPTYLLTWPVGTHTTSARQGREDTTASGTYGFPPLLAGDEMTGAEAFGHLHHIRGTVVSATYQIITNPRFQNANTRYPSLGIIHHTITAREDSLDRVKRETLARLNRNRNSNSQLRWGKEIKRFTRAYNVRSYGINSDFDDPFPVYEKLAEPGIDEEARSYKVTATWKMRPLQSNGKFGPERNMRKEWEKGKKDHKDDYYFPSYKDNYVPFDFCKDNQKIYDLECNDSITRRVIDRDITERRLHFVGTPYSTGYTGYKSYDHKIGTKRVVIQDEN